MKSSDPLDDLLQQWQEPVAPPASFRREVWRRIALEGRVRRASLLERLTACFYRPVALSASLMLTLVLGGLLSWTGSERSPSEVQSRNQYLRSINPFDPTHPSGSGR